MEFPRPPSPLSTLYTSPINPTEISPFSAYRPNNPSHRSSTTSHPPWRSCIDPAAPHNTGARCVDVPPTVACGLGARPISDGTRLACWVSSPCFMFFFCLCWNEIGGWFDGVRGFFYKFFGETSLKLVFWVVLDERERWVWRGVVKNGSHTRFYTSSLQNILHVSLFSLFLWNKFLSPHAFIHFHASLKLGERRGFLFLRVTLYAFEHNGQ